MNFIGIIPARYQSTRFPGKPLALIQGRPMVQWVYERASQALGHVWVATDNQAIADCVQGFGGKYVMTSPDHPSGTDRCAEAARIISKNLDFDAVINIQGDEPFIHPEQISQLCACFTENVQIATLVKRVEDMEELDNPNRVKVVAGNNRQALYFSRAAIPFVRACSKEERLKFADFFIHIGMYGYRFDVLQLITELAPGSLEKAESLEQLRWMENGYTITVAETQFSTQGVDTPEDLNNLPVFIL